MVTVLYSTINCTVQLKPVLFAKVEHLISLVFTLSTSKMSKVIGSFLLTFLTSGTAVSEAVDAAADVSCRGLGERWDDLTVCGLVS